MAALLFGVGPLLWMNLEGRVVLAWRRCKKGTEALLGIDLEDRE